ncbi:site-specific integrase [Flavobacterium arcticum]|uniref:Site-specific integrase n=1 Tax=Flavobacterium arcticum TaxID=1784713 RepID=A0A345HAA6_9FLAO|nr:site-specific integrase [Flavobacterium arcticum]AXG73516.1 site-specific integrase [Flavobacterium arcticum]KAF2513306.1 site-specific integrase [Flavobacterium arcticum]
MASINITLRSKPNKKNEFPVILRIVKDRKSKLISLGMLCEKEDWDSKKNEFKKTYANASQRNRVLLKLQEKALKIIDEFALDDIDFTLNQFETKFRGRKSSSVTVSEFWKEKINDFIKAGRIGNSKPYKDTYNSFFKFHKNKNILFREVTPAFLDKYETFLRSNNNSNGGIGIKMRTIRALYNYAIKSGIVDEKYYPFKIYKISKFKAKGVKKALIRDEMKLMEAINTQKYPHLINTKNYLVFSYYMGGMNFVDMMKLKWDNIQGDRIQYIRSKTKGKFTVKMLEPVKQIIAYYKAQNRPTKYVFPILLKEDLSPVQIDNRKHKTLRRFNKQLKEIAEIQGLEQNVTSYVIRHSFATNLKFAGISTDVIGRSMGHADVSITQAYLKEFKDDIIDDAMSKLLEEPILQYAS